MVGEIPLSISSPFVGGEKKAEALLDRVRCDGVPAGLPFLLRWDGESAGEPPLLAPWETLTLFMEERTELWPWSTEVSVTTAGIRAGGALAMLLFTLAWPDRCEAFIWLNGYVVERQRENENAESLCFYSPSKK